MEERTVEIKSISQLHEIMGLPKPVHPLISLIDASKMMVTPEQVGVKVIADLYMVSLKDKSCAMDYGRNSFDFEEGVLVFSAPGQVYTASESVARGDINGWMLYFHPDLIRNTHLSEVIDDYTFFNYDVYEALHLSEQEEQRMNESVKHIQTEYEQRIDNHSQRVIVSSLELLLNYSSRFYERQFNTRIGQSQDIVVNFEKEVKAYFKADLHLKDGIPSTGFFADKFNLSKHYFSDLYKKAAGRTPKDRINDLVVEKAKDLLIGTSRSVSEIAYDLGFNYPHYFTRFFKSKTGHTPLEYRSLN